MDVREIRTLPKQSTVVVVREPPLRTIVVAPPLPRPAVVGVIAVRAPALRLPVGGVAVATTVAAATYTRRIVSAGARRDAHWNHNGSVMRLTLKTEKVSFTYEVPRAGLSSLGIDRGTLLFDGRNEGGIRFSGTAYTFSRQCGPGGFDVAGEATPVGDRLEVKGLRPIRNERCDIVRREEETLVFDLDANRTGVKVDVPAPLLPIEQVVGASGGVAGDVGPGASDQRSMPGGQAGDPVWLHNGTPMRVEVQDLSVRFYADAGPAAGEAGAGSPREKPLFEGRNISDTHYAGSAYSTSKQCGEVPFRVQGGVSRDGGRLELTGQKPELDDKCGVTGHRTETLVFELR